MPRCVRAWFVGLPFSHPARADWGGGACRFLQDGPQQAWDCPRVEVMMSSGRSADRTHRSWSDGTKTPLARRVEDGFQTPMHRKQRTHKCTLQCGNLSRVQGLRITSGLHRFPVEITPGRNV